MNSQIMTTIIAIVATAAMLITAGCETDGQTGALLGGAAGAGIGQLAGRNTESTLIGAAVGAGAGYLLGNEADKKQSRSEIENVRYEMNTVTVHVTNSNGSIIPVRLQKSGVGFIGPRGEYYSSLPSSEQLRPIYGF